MAFFAPLYPRLRKACALGRKDRLRGNVLQLKLVEVIMAYSAAWIAKEMQPAAKKVPSFFGTIPYHIMPYIQSYLCAVVMRLRDNM